MNSDARNIPRLESLLAGLLRYGTWVASVVTAVGLILTMINGGPGVNRGAGTAGVHVITSGIACFILLPVLRVILMLIVFVRARDYRFAVITAVVLIIILAGVGIGMHFARP